MKKESTQEKAETTEMDAKAEETAEPASPSGVENVASEAAALSVQKRGRVSQTDDAGFFEPPPTKRPAVATRAGPGGQAGGPGYAPPTTPALADAPNGRGEGGILSPAQALHFAACGPRVNATDVYDYGVVRRRTAQFASELSGEDRRRYFLPAH